MSINELKERLEEVERAIFYEQMADFMNWDNYRRLKAERQTLKNQLKLLVA